jgi:hypothetical protein
VVNDEQWRPAGLLSASHEYPRESIAARHVACKSLGGEEKNYDTRPKIEGIATAGG